MREIRLNKVVKPLDSVSGLLIPSDCPSASALKWLSPLTKRHSPQLLRHGTDTSACSPLGAGLMHRLSPLTKRHHLSSYVMELILVLAAAGLIHRPLATGLMHRLSPLTKRHHLSSYVMELILVLAAAGLMHRLSPLTKRHSQLLRYGTDTSSDSPLATGLTHRLSPLRKRHHLSSYVIELILVLAVLLLQD
ncbi:hypothetical protein J6590_003618 [Homalodisca vitripennis]|nr:hypothetical protein J6590_003618 [Homalodisca vitripennis]